MNDRPKIPVTLIVVRHSQPDGWEQERLRQSRVQFNLTCTIVAVGAAFCFTGVGLFWSGHISENAIAQTINLISRMMTISVQLLEKKLHPTSQDAPGLQNLGSK